LFCFGVGVFIFLVECFVLELAFLCSWSIVLFWSWRLYFSSWNRRAKKPSNKQFCCHSSRFWQPLIACWITATKCNFTSIFIS
jgi:hypothetical protein